MPSKTKRAPKRAVVSLSPLQLAVVTMLRNLMSVASPKAAPVSANAAVSYFRVFEKRDPKSVLKIKPKSSDYTALKKYATIPSTSKSILPKHVADALAEINTKIEADQRRRNIVPKLHTKKTAQFAYCLIETRAKQQRKRTPKKQTSAPAPEQPTE